MRPGGAGSGIHSSVAQLSAECGPGVVNQLPGYAGSARLTELRVRTFAAALKRSAAVPPRSRSRCAHPPGIDTPLTAAPHDGLTKPTGHPDTKAATRRVYSLWRTVPDADAAVLGAELLGAITDIHGPEAAVVRRTRMRLQALAAAPRKVRNIT